MTYNDILILRTEHKISQIKLAEYSGYSPAMISGWELNKATPTQSQIYKLAETISNILVAEKEQGINIRKKRIQNSGKVKGEAPAMIRSYNDYNVRMSALAYSPTPYSELVNNMCPAVNLADAPKAIALFSGCGGMTLGFTWAGFNVLGHVEIDNAANSIYAANFPNSPLLSTDITKITDADVYEWIKQFGEIDIVIGGPPCQGFSLAGKRNPNDERNELFQHYIRIVDIIRPKVFVMENVRLMTSMKDFTGNLFINKIMDGFKNIGYSADFHYVNAQDYGIPQFRERVIVVGINTTKVAGKYIPPPPTHSNSNQLSPTNSITDKIRTFRDATIDLPALESGQKTTDPLHWAISHPHHVIEWLKDVPEGHSAHENENPSLRPPSGFNTTYKRIVWDEPCSTISTNFNMISGCRNVHPTSTRSLTIREATRAQSFPDNFAFFGKWSDIRRVIGNAVPPMLAEAIANSINTQLFKG
jgi:DNA (cytosine-5)-methyltransferase 1